VRIAIACLALAKTSLYTARKQAGANDTPPADQKRAADAVADADADADADANAGEVAGWRIARVGAAGWEWRSRAR
jgi:hypothetical protein